MKRMLTIFLMLFLLSGCVGTEPEETPPPTLVPAKPVIYLYPREETTVTVKLTFDGTITSAYPAYEDAWTVIAQPDGTLIDLESGREYYCLFWEGKSDAAFDLTEGTVVAGQDTERFLEDALHQLGLTDKEANEFIIYWLPQMEDNPYNLISFQGEAYSDMAKLDITPAPDSILRIFMVWAPLDAPMDIPEQTLESFRRTGFTVVEWGGSEVTFP